MGKELAQLHEKVAELETIESGLQRELENSQGLLRIERKESEGVQDQMMSELDKRTKELGDSQEQFQTAQHGWMADKQQLENHLEGSDAINPAHGSNLWLNSTSHVIFFHHPM